MKLLYLSCHEILIKIEKGIDKFFSNIDKYFNYCRVCGSKLTWVHGKGGHATYCSKCTGDDN